MSNLEVDSIETVCGDFVSGDVPGSVVEILEPREVPLGGPRAFTVLRTLPQRARSLVGAWCFVDSYGPVPADHAGTMTVPPHPHTGLQTVTWLYAGEIEHRDSVGSRALIEPGQVNLMTAGAGIQHSEVSTAAATELHGAQLWIALPDRSRHVDPFFESFTPQPVTLGDATLRVFIGTLAGASSPVSAFTGLVGAQIDLPAGGRVEVPVDPTFEHALVVDRGTPRLQGVTVPTTRLGVVPAGAATLHIEAGDEPLRALLIGGEPLGEQIVMWWNFVGRSHDEIVAFREQWQSEVIAGSTTSGRFGEVADYPGAPLPAPELPNIRLQPRG
ncbi:MAG: pirin family protein [Pseudolysinimonas sp.]|uniref:pirin family protein n=1 Tax=Pseudolysinimonas sp. TaxID=2680009 RepID=UPI0032647C25